MVHRFYSAMFSVFNYERIYGELFCDCSLHALTIRYICSIVLIIKSLLKRSWLITRDLIKTFFSIIYFIILYSFLKLVTIPYLSDI